MHGLAHLSLKETEEWVFNVFSSPHKHVKVLGNNRERLRHCVARDGDNDYLGYHGEPLSGGGVQCTHPSWPPIKHTTFGRLVTGKEV